MTNDLRSAAKLQPPPKFEYGSEPIIWQARGKGTRSAWMTCAQSYAETQAANPDSTLEIRALAVVTMVLKSAAT